MGNKIPVWSSSHPGPGLKKSIFEYSCKNIDGTDIPLETFRGHSALLITNVASKCGHTKTQYTGLEKMRQEIIQEIGTGKFEILAFPCSQFANQEFSDSCAIKDFVQQFKLTFPLFHKVDVNGPTTDPLFQFLKYNSKELGSESKGVITLQPIGWNFGKFLIDKNGLVVKYYGPKISLAECKADVLKTCDGTLEGWSRPINMTDTVVSTKLPDENPDEESCARA